MMPIATKAIQIISRVSTASSAQPQIRQLANTYHLPRRPEIHS
jgi:hypothetical protein